ncbi:MAG: ATP-binding protein [Deltaproteobacteria bacterium]|nr:ATP-binding protein [Deltaproteobacteria bacterium]
MSSPFAVGTPLPVLRKLRRRFWLAYMSLDLPFVPAVPVAFVAMNGLWDTEELFVLARWFALVYIIKTIIWSGLLFALLRPVDTWLDKTAAGTATDHDLKAAALASHRFPYFFLGPWSLIWGLQYLVIFFDQENLPVATEYPSIMVPFCITVGLAAGIFNIPFNTLLLSSVNGAMSLALRSRGLTVRRISDSIRIRLVVITLGIAISATGWMVCAGYTIEMRTNAHDLRLRGRLVREDVAEHVLRHLFSGKPLSAADVESALRVSRENEPLIHPFAIFDGKFFIDEETGNKLRANLGLLYLEGGDTEVERHDPRLHLAVTAEKIDDRLLVGAVVDVKPRASDLYVFGVIFFFINVVIFAPMVAFLVGRALADPIASVGAALQDITARTDFTGLGRIPVYRNDELGVLSGRANEMIDALERIWADNRQHLVDVEEKNMALVTAQHELLQNNEDLVAAAKAKSQFLASMSHELRTPLNAIIGFSRLVLKKTEGIIPEQQKKNLRLINDSGQALLALVNDLLDFERIEAGRLKITIEDVDVDDMISTMEATLKPNAEKKAMTLACRVEPYPDQRGPLRVKTDPDRLRQILVNFTNNAIKYSEKGHVDVVVRRTAAGVVFSVKDEGIGIPKDQLQKIFEPFHQVDGGFSREREGVGLGLAIVGRLVEMLGGTIGVESEAGVGSTFSFTLPLSTIVEALPADSPVSTPPTPGPHSGPLPLGVKRVDVVVVEDDAATLALLEQHLNPGEKPELGQTTFRIRRARTVKEAVACFDDVVPAAVVLDLSLPGIDDGFAVLEDLRARAGGKEVQVVVFTARDVADIDGARLTKHHASVVQKGDQGAELVAEALRASFPATTTTEKV